MSVKEAKYDEREEPQGTICGTRGSTLSMEYE